MEYKVLEASPPLNSLLHTLDKKLVPLLFLSFSFISPSSSIPSSLFLLHFHALFTLSPPHLSLLPSFHFCSTKYPQMSNSV